MFFLFIGDTVHTAQHVSNTPNNTNIGGAKSSITKPRKKNIRKEEVSHYLTYLAVDRKVISSVQNLAPCASVFIYQHGLKRELTLLTNTIRAKVATRVESQRYYLMMRQ